MAVTCGLMSGRRDGSKLVQVHAGAEPTSPATREVEEGHGDLARLAFHSNEVAGVAAAAAEAARWDGCDA